MSIWASKRHRVSDKCCNFLQRLCKAPICTPVVYIQLTLLIGAVYEQGDRVNNRAVLSFGESEKYGTVRTQTWMWPLTNCDCHQSTLWISTCVFNLQHYHWLAATHWHPRLVASWIDCSDGGFSPVSTMVCRVKLVPELRVLGLKGEYVIHFDTTNPCV